MFSFSKLILHGVKSDQVSRRENLSFQRHFSQDTFFHERVLSLTVPGDHCGRCPGGAAQVTGQPPDLPDPTSLPGPPHFPYSPNLCTSFNLVDFPNFLSLLNFHNPPNHPDPDDLSAPSNLSHC